MTTHQQLVHTLLRQGVLPPEWHETVASVDRGLFIPEVCEGGDFTADPEGWLRSVYADAPVVTQVNDGKPTPDSEFRLFTSSSTMPSIMLEMLALLDVREGHRVLEIGTGTGYHAAWLSHRLGAANVTSVEFDEAVLSAAVKNLSNLGHHPTTVLGNGHEGHPAGAPYDRIICTCTMRNVPGAWLEQCPDGRIVTPWGSSYFSGSFLTLTVKDGQALGTFSGDPAFMWDRTARAGSVRPGGSGRGGPGAPETRTTTDIPPQHVIQDAPAFFTGLSLTDVRYRWCPADDDSGEATLRFVADDGMSWATVAYVPDAAAYEVEQHGRRALWDEVRHEFLRWHDLGAPDRSRFGVSVSTGAGTGTGGQQIWLDDLHHVVAHTGAG
ncbi:methyltransferase domain-containing protein [Streptomyces paludis]|uniref:Protein-L-isoaspartate O-methyltransferase n=1 Tax=Streptomyces paludis TaxID=2282738 RepID=A0A345HNE1_9ACTN|nr:methyltransferase domain-containing protein [Streptomyces paludis]AXG78215.1 methyltransferase domain-containing protein [Streptomyces paludis]